MGVASRRAVEELVLAGRVRVNGQPAHLGQRVDASHDLIEVDGAAVGVRPGLVHYLLNKAAGVVTTAADPEGRPTVLDGVPAEPRVFPVGRLDRDTEGLLLLTNDGTLTHRLTHPSFGVEKEYLAHVRGTPGRGALRRLRASLDWEEHGAAPLLGVDGVCFVGHGASGARAYRSAIRTLVQFVEQRVNEHIREEIEADHDSAA